MAGTLPVIKLPRQSQSARPDVVATPFQFFLTGAENLRISIWNSLAGVTVTVRLRFVNDLGELNWQSFTFTPTSDRATNTYDQPLGGGVVSNVIVFAGGQAPVVGQTFVQVAVTVGTQPGAPRFGTLVQGYITSNQTLSYPGSPIQSSLDGGGYLRFVNGTQPAPGNEIAETVPTGARWELVSVVALFATSAVVAHRRPEFILKSSGNAFLRIPTVANVDALGSVFLEFSQGLPYEVTLSSDVLATALPSTLPLPAGAVFGTFTLNIDAGDQYAVPRYIIREWIEAA